MGKHRPKRSKFGLGDLVLYGALGVLVVTVILMVLSVLKGPV